MDSPKFAYRALVELVSSVFAALSSVSFFVVSLPCFHELMELKWVVLVVWPHPLREAHSDKTSNQTNELAKKRENNTKNSRTVILNA